jgi:CHASE3 domain sensor protein
MIEVAMTWQRVIASAVGIVFVLALVGGFTYWMIRKLLPKKAKR